MTEYLLCDILDDKSKEYISFLIFQDISWPPLTHFTHMELSVTGGFVVVYQLLKL